MSQFSPPTSLTETNSLFVTDVTTSFATVNQYNVGGTEFKMIAKTVTTTTEIRGLSRADAIALGSSSDYNYSSKHGVRFKSDNTSSASWMYTPDCEGVECVAHPRRINEADIWRVVVTHSSTTVSHSADGTSSAWQKEIV